MPHGTPQPDDGLTAQKIREAILAGAAEGAAERVRQIIADATAGLDEVTAVLKALAADSLPPSANVAAHVGPASATAIADTPQVIVKSGGAIASLRGEGTLGISRANVAAVALSGEGALGIGPADVAAAVDELRAVGQPDIEKLAGRPPVQWSKQELALNSLFLVAVAYWLLPPAEQQYLVGMAGLVQAVVAVVALLRHNDN